MAGCQFQSWQLLGCTHVQCYCDTFGVSVSVVWSTKLVLAVAVPMLGGDEKLSCLLSSAAALCVLVAAPDGGCR